MKEKLKRLNALSKRTASRAVVLALMAPAAFAQTTPTAAEQSISDAQVVILALIAAGGAGLIAISLGKVGWTVAAKWIGRLGGKG